MSTQVGQLCAEHEEHTLRVDTHGLPEKFGGRLHECDLVERHTGIVGHTVQSAEGLHRKIDELLGVLFL
ncbi:hypothetical protein QP028_01970 [Corynebacterium suedekumii]|nr:hypothetical protein QP028_01970 [Corynebacterium suedekumii]